jgi:hypothetical protein
MRRPFLRPGRMNRSRIAVHQPKNKPYFNLFINMIIIARTLAFAHEILLVDSHTQRAYSVWNR